MSPAEIAAIVAGTVGYVVGSLAVWCASAIVDGVEHVIAWRRRPRLPRAEARRKGAR